MKKKSITILVIVLALIAVFGIVACKPKPNGDDDKTGAKVNIAILPDLVDCGQEKYLSPAIAVYGSSVRTTQAGKLEEKQTESREDYDGGSDWSNANYYPFDKPHFDGSNKWIEDDATTITKVFCYSEPNAILDVMSRAAIDENRMIKLVEYITRTDADFKVYEKGDIQRYPLTKGSGSAIWDYDNLDEIEDIRDNFSTHKVGNLAFGHDEDFWDDLAKLKKRKIETEIYSIFEDEAAMFARFQTEYMTYQIQVLLEVMIPAYDAAKDALGLPSLGDKTRKNSIIDSDMFKNYMREEIFDFSTLSYLLAFADLTNPQQKNDLSYLFLEPSKKKTVMTLYGYTYQYEKRAHEVFDDNKIVAINGKPEYEDYLWLSHKKYFGDDMESGSKGLDLALRFTAYDRRNYEKAHRYSAGFYKLYYEAQFDFQFTQEKRDREIYIDDVEYLEGIGYVFTSNALTYSEEMLSAMEYGFKEALKISDVQWEYSGVDSNVGEYTRVNTDWHRLTDTQKNQRGQNAIKKVRLQIQQLKSQKYVLDHKTMSSAEFTSFLKYQIKSYSADYIRAIQDNKKEQVIARWKLKRAYKYFSNDYSYTEILENFVGYHPQPYETEAIEKKIEDLGRAKAMYQNLYANYTGADIEGQIQRAFRDWVDVSDNIRETLSKDYEKYNNSTGSGDKVLVDDYFEETLIKKVYDCKGTDDECGYKDKPYYVSEHRYVKSLAAYDDALDQEIVECEKVYAEDWSISRLLNAHEDVFRHMAGQVEIEFKRVETLASYYDDAQSWGINEQYKSDLVQKIPGKRDAWLRTDEKETLESGDDLRTVVWKDTYWNNQPVYEVGKSGVTGTSGVAGSVFYVTANCEYVFDAWCVDEDLLYEVKLDETVRFDIRIYPRYKITNKTRTSP